MIRAAVVVTTAFVAAHLIPLTWNRPLVAVDTADYAAQARSRPVQRNAVGRPKAAAHRPRSMALRQQPVGDHHAPGDARLGFAGRRSHSAITRHLHARAVRVFAAAALLVMSMVPAFEFWETRLLSDSLSVSFAVLLVAVCLAYATRPTPALLCGLVVVAALAALVRDSNGIMLLLVAGLAAVASLAGRRRIALRAALVIAAAVAAVQAPALAADRSEIVMLDEIQLRSQPPCGSGLLRKTAACRCRRRRNVRRPVRARR